MDSIGFSRPAGLFLGCIGKIIYSRTIKKTATTRAVYAIDLSLSAFDLCRTLQDCPTMSDVFQWKPRVLLQIEASWAQQLLSGLCVTYSGTHFGPGLGIFWFLQFFRTFWTRWKIARPLFVITNSFWPGGQPTDQVGGVLGAQILCLCWSEAQSRIFGGCLILALFWLAWPMTTWPDRQICRDRVMFAFRIRSPPWEFGVVSQGRAALARHSSFAPVGGSQRITL